MGKGKAVVIGLGNIGLMYDFEMQRPHPSSHVFAYKESKDFELACCIDPDKNKEPMLRSILPGTEFFPSLDIALESGALDDIDVVSVCTPPSTHLSILEALISQRIGRLIFCEKPLVSNLHEVNELRRLISGHKDVLVVPNISRRWNSGLRNVTKVIREKKYGDIKKISVRYTRGIYNTGSHMFDILKMWTGEPIQYVHVLNETYTSAFPEKSFSFYFTQESGVVGYAEAMNDEYYYLFEIDIYLSQGKIEMRNSGDDIYYYRIKQHHLFEGFKELVLEVHQTEMLRETCIGNAIKNIRNYMKEGEPLYCNIEDAIYPLFVAESLMRSYKSRNREEIAQ